MGWRERNLHNFCSYEKVGRELRQGSSSAHTV
jgi:hypothetical protein